MYEVCQSREPPLRSCPGHRCAFLAPYQMPLTFYTRDGKGKSGPISSAQLQALAKSGQLQPADMVWKEGMAKWTPASKIKGLFSSDVQAVTANKPQIAASTAHVTDRRRGTTGNHSVTCPTCNKALKAPDEKAGAKVRCNGCQTVFRIPPRVAPKTQQGVEKEPTEPPTPVQEKDRRLATWIFGSLLLVFFVCVFVFCPAELPEFKQRMLAISSALLSGIFAYFMTGQMKLEIKGIKNILGNVGVKATGGTAVFGLVLIWWLSPLAPVGLDKKLAEVREDTSAIRQDTKTIEVKLSQLSIDIRQSIGITKLGPEYANTPFHIDYVKTFEQKGGSKLALLTEYQGYLAQHPQNAMFYYVLAWIHHSSGNAGKAIELAKEGLGKDKSYMWNRRLLLYENYDTSLCDMQTRLELETVHYKITGEERDLFLSGKPDNLATALRQLSAGLVRISGFQKT